MKRRRRRSKRDRSCAFWWPDGEVWGGGEVDVEHGLGKEKKKKIERKEKERKRKIKGSKFVFTAVIFILSRFSNQG